jgi:hypothetical protein
VKAANLADESVVYLAETWEYEKVVRWAADWAALMAA